MDYTLKELAEISAVQHPGVDEAALHEAETLLGAKFPSQYRELVKLVNGPEFFDWQFFPIKDERHPKQSWDDVVQHNISKQRPGFLPPEYVAFAESVGDYLCFKKVNGNMEDTVYMYAEEINFPELVANDLKSALIEIMSYAEEDEDLEHLNTHGDEKD